mgnify:CR=1 FL=1
MSDLNSVNVIGRLIDNPQLKKVNDSSVVNFTIANNQKFKDTEKVNFLKCFAWGKLAELIAQYCKKGHRIAVNGQIQQRSYDDTNGNKKSIVEISVKECQFLTAKDIVNAVKQVENTPEAIFDNDIPF